MVDYRLCLESGPRQRTTMVHVVDLLGCVAQGPTTSAALAATPDAIRSFQRFLAAHDPTFDAQTPFVTQSVEHITEGAWLGNGSPYLLFATDLTPLSADEIAQFATRFRWMCADLADWTAAQTPQQLDASPAADTSEANGGRTARAILLHVLGATGSYLSAALGSAPGFGANASAAARGTLSLGAALRAMADLAEARVIRTTDAERATIRELPAGSRTLRQGMRRMLEHAWEHLVELHLAPDFPGPPVE